MIFSRLIEPTPRIFRYLIIIFFRSSRSHHHGRPDFTEFCRRFKNRYLFICPNPFRFGQKVYFSRAEHNHESRFRSALSFLVDVKHIENFVHNRCAREDENIWMTIFSCFFAFASEKILQPIFLSCHSEGSYECSHPKSVQSSSVIILYWMRDTR